MKKYFLIVFLWLTVFVMGFENTSIIQVTLTDSKSGLLQGSKYVEVSLLDRASNKTHWSEYQYIDFEDGYAEVFVGPIDYVSDIDLPYVVLKIDVDTISFPIYPALLAIYSKYSAQLIDQDALYVEEGKVGDLGMIFN